MPAKKRPKPIYQRGSFKLYARDDRPNLEIVWYDAGRGRERSTSAGTADHGQAKLALDRLYLEQSGERICQGCGRPLERDGSPLLLRAIADYLLRSEGKAGYKATRGRLAHVADYVAETGQTSVTCAQIDEAWVNRFRAWLSAKPVVAPKSGHSRPRALGHIEGCVRQLVAAINATPGETAQFKALAASEVAASPTYRADVPMLAAMFRYCLYPERKPGESEKFVEMRRIGRLNLLAYLRAAVATWARPEEIFDLADDRQWFPEAGVLDLNPPGRRQTRKYRTRIPVARQFAPFLDAMKGNYIDVGTIRHSWADMRAAIGLPSARAEAGEKLIRRSMATLVRKRIGEANWRQGEMMLGHVKVSTSDIYALPDPANLGLALAATEAVIDEIEALCPGAYRTFTASAPMIKVVKGGKNG